MNEQQLALAIKNDTLSILLCNRVHSDFDIKSRAIRISRTCKIIRDRTKDKFLYNACRSVIKATSNGHYKDVVASIVLTEQNYWREYKGY